MWVKQYYVNKKSSLAAVQSCVQGVFFLLEFQFLKHVHKVYGIGRRITLRLLVPSAQPGNVYAALQAFSIDMLMHFARGLPFSSIRTAEYHTEGAMSTTIRSQWFTEKWACSHKMVAD